MGLGLEDLLDEQVLQDQETQEDFLQQYLFPAKKLSIDPRTGLTKRPHVGESGLQKAVKAALIKAGVNKKVSCNTFRHCFATHLLENNVNIHTVKELMGHSDVKATEIYTHLMEKKSNMILSPLDSL